MAMAGIIDERSELIDLTDDDSLTRDAALILAALKIGHYKVATYSGLILFASGFDQSEIVDILKQSLYEENELETILSVIAKDDAIPGACRE